MKIVETCRVVDALGEWGTHNAPWSARREVTDAFEGVDFALTHYSDLVCRVIAAFPFGCVRAEILAEDLPKLVLYNNVSAAEWATAIQKADTRAGEYVRAMTAAQTPVVGPLTCACQSADVDGTVQIYPPFVIFDGWNRVAAWILQGRAGKAYPIVANLILTTQRVSLPRRPRDDR